MTQQPSSWMQDLGRLVLVWGLAVALAGLWVVLDQGVPAWDQAEHLSLSMNHWWVLTHSQAVLRGDLRSLWMLSPKYPPVLYLVTAGVHSLIGPGPDQAMVANALFALVLLISTYGLGRHLFSARIGLLAAGLCLLMPRLLHIGLDYQLDYAVTATTVLAFWCLTAWRDAPTPWRQWLWMLALGGSFGLALMTKQSAVLFLAVPLAWVTVTTLINRRWGRLLQLFLGAATTAAVMVPWLSVNWVFQFSIVENTNVRSAQVEGDPALNTLDAWIYYWQDLPAAVSWGLLIVPLVGIALWYLGLVPGRRKAWADGTPGGRWWLLTYLVGAYGLWSAIVNKDPRYVAPYLPGLAIFLAWGFACWWRRWPWVTWVTLGLTALVTVFNLFPLGFIPGARLASLVAPNGQRHPYRGTPYPHGELIRRVAQTQPYQIATIGGLHSTAAVNQHNVSYYGKLQDYQVYGRQVGSRPSQLEKDLRSLSWFYAQGNPQQPWPPTQPDHTSTVVRELERRPEFRLDQIWDLPANQRLYLYRREQLPITVTPLPDNACTPEAPPRLNRVVAPAQVPPGQAMPILYEWIGSWDSLRRGLVLLTWQPTLGSGTTDLSSQDWIHDHSIGLGTLRPASIQANQAVLSEARIDPKACFQVTERTATLPPKNLANGDYRLVGMYVDTEDNASDRLKLPEVRVTIDAQAQPNASPELDWVTQLRQTARLLPQGPQMLDEVFDPIGQINTYDPVQNYTVQAEQSLRLRWQAAPTVLDYGYGLMLSQVLQLKVEDAISTLETLVWEDAKNPYAHAYLGFVNLYALRPRAAQTALARALELAPESPEINGLSAIAALFQGNLWGTWQKGRAAVQLSSQAD